MFFFKASKACVERLALRWENFLRYPCSRNVVQTDFLCNRLSGSGKNTPICSANDQTWLTLWFNPSAFGANSTLDKCSITELIVQNSMASCKFRIFDKFLQSAP